SGYEEFDNSSRLLVRGFFLHPTLPLKAVPKDGLTRCPEAVARCPPAKSRKPSFLIFTAA
ncbi:MAG: hypothetical protein ACYTX0_52285, partial [Nostoc sp.]